MTAVRDNETRIGVTFVTFALAKELSVLYCKGELELIYPTFQANHR